jgi:hypothetical protein
MTKLFGISAAGFNSGEDDIENYNSMIEGEIRSKIKFTVVDLCKIACQVKYGFIPDDLMITFKPLRVLSAEQEETVKNNKFNRVIASYQSGITDGKTTKEALNKDALLPIELEENDKVAPPVEGQFTVGEDKVTA